MVNDEDPCTGFQRGEEITDDVAGFVVGPVVQDEAENVDVCDYGLGVEEVMFFEGYGGVVLWWEEGAEVATTRDWSWIVAVMCG